MARNVTRQVGMAHEVRKQIRDLPRHGVIRDAQHQYAGILDRVACRQNRDRAKPAPLLYPARGGSNGIVIRIAETDITHATLRTRIHEGRLPGPGQVRIEQEFHAARDGSGCTDSSSTRIQHALRGGFDGGAVFTPLSLRERGWG